MKSQIINSPMLQSVVVFVVVSLGVLLGTAGILYKSDKTSEAPIADITGESKNAKGEGSVTIVEFSDFQCPACQAVQDPLNQILAKYAGKVKFVYRYFPLTNIHKNAQLAAQITEASAIQGKFWQMHDKLFATQKEWEELKDPKETFVKYADEMGLDTAKLLKDVDSQEVKDRITKDVSDATRYRVNATPTFYINGIKTEFGQIESKLVILTK